MKVTKQKQIMCNSFNVEVLFEYVSRIENYLRNIIDMLREGELEGKERLTEGNVTIGKNIGIGNWKKKIEKSIRIEKRNGKKGSNLKKYFCFALSEVFLFSDWFSG